MAHKTRRRLSKSELKHDPVAENLFKLWTYTTEHLKEIIGAGIIILVLIIVVTGLIASSKKQNRDAMAGYLLAEMTYENSEQLIVSGDAESAMQALNVAYSISLDVYNQNRNRIWGQRAAILSAKIGIITGRNEEVITSILELLSTNPSDEISISAYLHLAVAQENRGGSEDLDNARLNYLSVIDIAGENSISTSDAMAGLSRLDFLDENYEESREWLEKSLEITSDTTEYLKNQLTRLNWILTEQNI